jgi:SagB-type dehydrogenase family enzyme
MPDLKKTSAHRYIQETKLDRETLFRRSRPEIQSCPVYKTMPEARTVILPRTWPKDGDSLLDILQQRRSKRKFPTGSLSLTDLACLLWAMQGITAQAGNFFFRTSPSAGALYPIETYVVADKVEGVERGIYHFNVLDFLLEEIRTDISGHEVAKAALDQGFIAKGAATFIWSAVFRRNMSKYGNRGGRYIFMDAAHICQNLLLGAEHLGLAACPVGAFYDDELNGLLHLDSQEESVLYLGVVG